jgi:hypothetical protein
MMRTQQHSLTTSRFADACLRTSECRQSVFTPAVSVVTKISSFEMPSSSYDILPNGISNDDYVIQNSSKKHDPQWAANASRGIISSHGNQLLEVQKLLQELTEHQDQILESIPLTEDAVLWASHTREFIEQVEKLPEYTKKAQAIEAEMQNLTKRIQRAKERVQKLNS